MPAGAFGMEPPDFRVLEARPPLVVEVDRHGAIMEAGAGAGNAFPQLGAMHTSFLKLLPRNLGASYRESMVTVGSALVAFLWRFMPW